MTIEYLTIEEFDPPNNEGAVNASSAPDWTISHDTLENNSPGTAVYLGTDNTLSNDCLTLNGQAGFGTYTTLDTSSLTGGASNITVTDNEISYNDTCNWENVSPDPVPTGEIQANWPTRGKAPAAGALTGESSGRPTGPRSQTTTSMTTTTSGSGSTPTTLAST